MKNLRNKWNKNRKSGPNKLANKKSQPTLTSDKTPKCP